MAWYWIILTMNLVVSTTITQSMRPPLVYAALIIEFILATILLRISVASWISSIPITIAQLESSCNYLFMQKIEIESAIDEAKKAIENHSTSFGDTIIELLKGAASIGGLALGIFGATSGNHIAHHAGHALHNVAHSGHTENKLEQLKENLEKHNRHHQDTLLKIKSHQATIIDLREQQGTPHKLFYFGFFALFSVLFASFAISI